MSANDGNKAIQSFGQEVQPGGSVKRLLSETDIVTSNRAKKLRLNPVAKANKEVTVLYKNLQFGDNEQRHSSCTSLAPLETVLDNNPKSGSSADWMKDRNRSGVIKSSSRSRSRNRNRTRETAVSKRSASTGKSDTARSGTNGATTARSATWRPPIWRPRTSRPVTWRPVTSRSATTKATSDAIKAVAADCYCKECSCPFHCLYTVIDSQLFRVFRLPSGLADGSALIQDLPRHNAGPTAKSRLPDSSKVKRSGVSRK